MDEIKIKWMNKVKDLGCKNESLSDNFFNALDASIKKSESERALNEYKRNDPKIRWSSISNFDTVLQSSIVYSNLGIDPLAEDMLSFIFYKSKSNGYDITFVEGVSCMEILARRYGINCPDNIKIELVYSTDVFKVIKKDINNPEDTCIHNVINPFERGEILGGYSLSQFENSSYNKLREMSIKEINKRTKETTSFFKKWPKEMCEKTLSKNAWSKVILNTTDLAEYYAAKKEESFIADQTDELPFNPENEL